MRVTPDWGQYYHKVILVLSHGEEKPIAFAAKALRKAERNYSVTRKELLALVWGMEHFAPYLGGKSFTVRTDHNALKWLNNFKEPKGQVARWIERLSIFDFKIEHRPGRYHGNADGVSRIPWEDNAYTLPADSFMKYMKKTTPINILQTQYSS